MRPNQPKLKVVCRNSPLSLIQVKELFSLLPPVEYELLRLFSLGDKNKHLSLMENIPGDFFTRELDEKLLNGEADIAVHSAKDLPYPLPAGLELYCLTGAKDKSDSLVSRNGLTLKELPTGARIGTSSATRKAELLKQRPDLLVVSIRGTIEERIAQVDDGTVDALIVATCALQRLGLEKRIAQTLPFETHPLQGNLAVTGKKDNPALKAIFAPPDVRKGYGKVTLVGFGPGNPDLLTIGGDKALEKADVIYHDDLIDRRFLKKYTAEKVYVGKRKGRHSYPQREINEMVYQAAIQGKKVVRLKGGDPMVFAHGREEIDFLKSRFIEVEVIPGISSGIALAAYTHIPLTHRGVASSVAFVTGHTPKGIPTPQADTLVYYMAGTRISEIATQLIAEGREPETPVALVYNVSMPDQRTLFSCLRELRFSTMSYPTPILMVIGRVVDFENGASREQATLITGTTLPTAKLTGEEVHVPLIRVEKAAGENLYPVLKKIPLCYDWIIFTSRYGATYFFDIADEAGLDIRTLGRVKIASVGPVTTAELKKFHIYPDLESPTGSAEGLVNYFRTAGISQKSILLPRSDKGLKFLSDELKALGNEVTDLPVYKNLINNGVELPELSQFRKILFSSPSAIEAFKKLYGNVPKGILLIAKGKTTENKLKQELHETFQTLQDLPGGKR